MKSYEKIGLDSRLRKTGSLASRERNFNDAFSFNARSDRNIVTSYEMGTINADLITGGTMSADYITGGTMSANYITSGTMSASRIVSGTITPPVDGEEAIKIGDGTTNRWLEIGIDAKDWINIRVTGGTSTFYLEIDPTQAVFFFNGDRIARLASNGDLFLAGTVSENETPPV